ncbi:MAG: hypothetical protein K6C95_03620 [Lachnospiraceae bacterium]|nr:hypothetical protein [Lachnospiraceae bacterium]
MKKTFIRQFTAGIACVSVIAALSACGSTAADTVAETTVDAQETANAVQEAADAVADAADEENMMSFEDEVKAVQDTLTFMGALKTKDDADKKVDIAIFRNDDGDVIYIYSENGEVVDYGMYTTEDAKTDDGRDYSKIIGGMDTYGYYFNEDLASGIIVDKDGNVYDAVELTEDDARAFVTKTLGG